jgi:hypothetical protein
MAGHKKLPIHWEANMRANVYFTLQNYMGQHYRPLKSDKNTSVTFSVSRFAANLRSR